MKPIQPNHRAASTVTSMTSMPASTQSGTEPPPPPLQQPSVSSLGPLSVHGRVARSDHWRHQRQSAGQLLPSPVMSSPDARDGLDGAVTTRLLLAAGLSTPADLLLSLPGLGHSSVAAASASSGLDGNLGSYSSSAPSSLLLDPGLLSTASWLTDPTAASALSAAGDLDVWTTLPFQFQDSPPPTLSVQQGDKDVAGADALTPLSPWNEAASTGLARSDQGAQRAHVGQYQGSVAAQEMGSTMAADDDGEEERRKRSSAASARFRQRKKQREMELEHRANDLTVRNRQLEQRVHALEAEVQYLRDLIVDIRSTATGIRTVPSSSAPAAPVVRRP